MMFSMGDIVWWGKAKPRPWPVQITGVSKDASQYRCKMFGIDGDVNDIERDIKEKHLFHFLQNVGKYRTTANAVAVDNIARRVACEETTLKRPREDDVEEMRTLRKELIAHVQTLHATMSEARELMSEMRDLQVSFKSSCQRHTQESLDVYRSNVYHIANN
jgi:hypothetical protein